MRAGAVVLLFAIGCAHVTLDRAALGTATALTMCDAAGTYKASSASWQGQGYNTREANLLLGEHPSTGAVTLYFATALTAEIVAWGLLPPKYRPAVLGFVAGVEASSVADNVDTVGLCGL